MSVTLEPVLNALGFDSPVKQRSLVKLLQAAGAFGQLPDVSGVINDKQADAILKNVTFDNTQQAANWLHDLTQETMLRPEGVERTLINEKTEYAAHRAALVTALRDAGMLSDTGPNLKSYDHVLLLGSKEPLVETRLETVKNLWEQGVEYGQIHLLGNERKLDETQEPIASVVSDKGKALETETQMLKARYYDTSTEWPQGLQAVPTYAVNSYDREGRHANTKETVETWLEANPHPDHGNILVISNQPYVGYQDAAVKSVLPDGYHVDTVGAPVADKDVNITLALDALARQIDVNFDKLQEKAAGHVEKYSMTRGAIDPDMIKSDPATYQFRSNYDKAGVTETGRYQADHWDEVLHGDPLLVHERMDGTLYVADGHHRLELAQRLNHGGKGPGVVSVSILREADGYTAEDVKIIAAYKNIAHGNTNPIETARVFKEAYSGKVHAELLPQLQMDKGNLNISYQLSDLSDKALDMVERQAIPVEMAADVAKRTTDERAQETLLAAIGDELNKGQAAPEKAPEKAAEGGFAAKFASKQMAATSFAQKVRDTTIAVGDSFASKALSEKQQGALTPVR